MESLGTALIVVGYIISAIGGLWLLVVAFQESALWGIGCLIVPFVSLIFVVTHWDDAKKPFLISVVGVIPIVIGMAINPEFMPA